jgi:salicylate hydroxylase
MTNQKPIHIAIVGGGFAGLALAIGILRNAPHIHITVYEAAPAFAEVVLGVAFGPNAVRALALIDPSLLVGFKRWSTYNASPERADTWLTFRWGIQSNDGKSNARDVIWDLQGLPLNASWSTAAKTGNIHDGWGMGIRSMNMVHRARLLEEMEALIPSGITVFRKVLVDFKEPESGEVRINFADGTETTVDAVIGCDGIKSRVREILYRDVKPAVQPEYSGEYGYRALVPAEQLTEALGEELALNGNIYVGYGRYIITYPVEHGKLINLVGTVREPMDYRDDQWIIPSTKEDALRDFEGWDPALVRLMSEFENRDKWGFFDLRHNQKYYRSRVCLVGDAAHASTPHLGAGAGMAIEDAYILSNLLSAAKNSQDLENCFRVYDTVRRPRTQKVVNNSRLAGACNEFVVEGIGDNNAKQSIDIDNRYRFVWNEDIEQHLVEARRLLAQDI